MLPFLAAIAALQVTMSVCRSVGLSVCLSVGLSPTSFMEVLCCCQCIYVVSIVVAQIIRIFCCHILHQLRQQLYKSQCRSVPNEFYRSVMLLLVYICCYYYCSLDYKNILLSYFAFLAAVAALQFTVSVSSKLHTIYKLVVMFM